MKSKAIKVIILTFPALIAAIGTFFFLRNMLLVPAAPLKHDIVRVEIAQGKGFSQIAADLKEKGVVKSVFGMKVLARLKSSGATIKAGEYELSPSMTPLEVLKKLLSGDIIKRRVLVKEGATLADIGASLEQAGVITKNEFLAAASDKAFLQKASIPATTVEGYLYPDTYFFSRPVTPQDVMWTMFEEAEKHWDPDFSNQLDLLHMSRHEILTLASIIEKETGKVDEMPIVSSVFYNRLQQGWKLESDPTVTYGLPNFNGIITKADLLNPQPYNTYQHLGLPPGPIANPSEKAVRAALYPKASPYMFFVADGTGGHTFSTTLREHNEAVAKYLAGQNPQVGRVEANKAEVEKSDLPKVDPVQADPEKTEVTTPVPVKEDPIKESSRGRKPKH